MNREDARKAKELYKKLYRLENELNSFKRADSFIISDSYGEASVPVESSIARQIAYKYINEQSYDIKKQLEEMGFAYGEPPDIERAKVTMEIAKEEVSDGRIKDSGSSIISQASLQRAGEEELNKQYAKVYGEWPKKETINEGKV